MRGWLKDIPGFEWRYAVDMGGNVYSYHRGGKYLKASITKSGHLLVPLCGTMKRYVHELVLTTFIGPRPSDRHVARHLDGDHTNNSVFNLHWGTHSQNMLDIKWNNPNSKRNKLTVPQVRAIKDMLDIGESQASIAMQFGVHQTNISAIKRGAYHYDV